MSKLTAFILCLVLCGCDEYQTQEQGNEYQTQEQGNEYQTQEQHNRIQFKEQNGYHQIVAVDSIEFLVNYRTGHMIRITKGDDK